MSLLDDVLEAGGGADRLQGLNRFTAHLSLKGGLPRSKGKDGFIHEVVVEGSIREPELQITGFANPDRRALLSRDRVAIERSDGVLLAERLNPVSSFAKHDELMPWDDLHFAYYSGCFIWSCFAQQFQLIAQDVQITELPTKHERSDGWRSLKIALPTRLAVFAGEQIAHFDGLAMLRCVEYSPTLATRKRLVEDTSAHQRFSNVVIPTLRQGRSSDDHQVRTRHSDLEVEIFDAAFS